MEILGMISKGYLVQSPVAPTGITTREHFFLLLYRSSLAC